MLAVNEIFGPTIQGEGKSAGKEVMFVRMSGCNLACVWCDTPYTWNWVGTKFAHPEKFDKAKEVRIMSEEDIYGRLIELGPNTKAVVISGGEPMLQQGRMISFLKLLRNSGYWIEIETNGTVEIYPEVLQLVDQINCSPKLANSGPDNPLSKRENVRALRLLAEHSKTTFKFVISSDEDMVEVMDLVTRYKMYQVYLMPEGRTREEQEARQNSVYEISRRYAFRFSARLHVLQWDTARAV